MTNSKNFTRYRILSCQYLFLNNKYRDIVQKFLIEVCTDSGIDYNLRADASDTLLKHGDSDSRQIAREILLVLGRQNSFMKTTYGNSQNVHDEFIDDSIDKSLKSIMSIKIKEVIDFEKCVQGIESLCIESYNKTQCDYVKSSIYRISVDQTLYNGYTLRSIASKVYSIIIVHENRESLLSRLVEELIDMSNTCSTGHISRLVNVFSGFMVDGVVFNINIGIKKEIQNVLISSISNLINKMTDIDLRDKIVDEMSQSGNISQKPHLSYIFRQNLLSLESNLYSQYVDSKMIDVDTFREYFRDAVSFFEEG